MVSINVGDISKPRQGLGAFLNWAEENSQIGFRKILTLQIGFRRILKESVGEFLERVQKNSQKGFRRILRQGLGEFLDRVQENSQIGVKKIIKKSLAVIFGRAQENYLIGSNSLKQGLGKLIEKFRRIAWKFLEEIIDKVQRKYQSRFMRIFMGWRREGELLKIINMFSFTEGLDLESQKYDLSKFLEIFFLVVLCLVIK